MPPAASLRSRVAQSLDRSPVIGVVRTASQEEARRQAHWLLGAGLELVEITFSVPGAADLVRELLRERREQPEQASGGWGWIGMGTVTGAERAEQAVAAGAEFLVTPNTSSEVAAVARRQDLFLVLGALTPTEVVQAAALGADLVKVYPLPPVGGPGYLATIRQPLADLPMLAAGGFGVEEIPAYRRAGARAFGLGPPLFGVDEAETRHRVERALAAARAGLEERGESERS
jgi:2-dehydro-3-deoxyphosphogluconate aldolase/(4S)-4-hydroxy-2-oxoglutarate aldolase